MSPNNLTCHDCKNWDPDAEQTNYCNHPLALTSEFERYSKALINEENLNASDCPGFERFNVAINQPEITIVWEKELDDAWTLQEHESDYPYTLRCAVIYTDLSTDQEQFFWFGAWGMEREEITTRDCWIACQGLSYENANIALAGFKPCIDYYQPYLEGGEEPGYDDDDDDDADVCPLCDGVGDVEELLSECPDCGGSGYL